MSVVTVKVHHPHDGCKPGTDNHKGGNPTVPGTMQMEGDRPASTGASVGTNTEPVEPIMSGYKPQTASNRMRMGGVRRGYTRSPAAGGMRRPSY